jgi:hypothetical protein
MEREGSGRSYRDFDYERDQSYAGEQGRWEGGRWGAGEGRGGYWNSAEERDERPYDWEEEPRWRHLEQVSGRGYRGASYGEGEQGAGGHGGQGQESHVANAYGRYGRYGSGSYGGYGGFGSNAPGPRYGSGSSYRGSRGFGSSQEGHYGQGQGQGYQGGQSYSRYGHEGNYVSDRVEWQQQQRGRAPKGYTRSDERIREDVSDRLVEGNVDAGEMEVEVKGGEVELKGIAPSREIKHRAETIAASVSGVKDVSNHLRIRREGESSAPSSSSFGRSSSGSPSSSSSSSSPSSSSQGGSSANGERSRSSRS